jgi:hypothetical protein
VDCQEEEHAMTREATLVTKLSGAIDSDRELRDLVRGTDRILAEELGKSGGQLAAEWGVVRDSAGRLLLQLTLSDLAANAQVIGRFAPEELGNENHLRVRLRRMWGDLLEIRSHRQLKELLGTSEGQEDG